MSQEDFSLVSSRTYVSSLERGLKSPTIQKVEELASVLNVHPLTLLALAYADPNQSTFTSLFDQIAQELSCINAN